MGKFIDLMLSRSWEEYQRIQLEKAIRKKLEETPKEDLDKIKKLKRIKK